MHSCIMLGLLEENDLSEDRQDRKYKCRKGTQTWQERKQFLLILV